VPLDVSDRPELLVILDSHGIIYRSYFALRDAFASTVRRTGEPVWAVYGYANSLLYVLDELHPTHIIAAWDGPGPTFRHEADEEYKATRAPMPDDLKPQIGRVRELLDAFRIPVVEAPGFEADDVLGTLATQAAAAGVETVLVTLDTDMVQLVQPHVRVLMYRPYQRDYVLYDAERVRERWGFGPERMTDYKALVGDTTDNIAGVKGIGEKGAKALIEAWGSIEEMLDHLEELKPPRAQKALAAAPDEARHYKRMATIVTDVPEVQLDLDAARVHDYDRGAVLGLFQELEFRSLVSRLPQHADMAGAPESAGHAEGAITRGGDYELVTTPERLAEVVEAVRAAGRFGFEVVADDEHPMRAAYCLVGVALSIEAGRGWYVPFGHTQEPPPLQEGQQELDLEAGNGAEPLPPLEQLPREAVLDAIAPLFLDPKIERVSNNGKNHLLALAAAPDGFWTASIDFDTSIAGYVLGERSVEVRGLAFERLGHELVEPKSLLGTGRKAIPFSRTAPDEAKEYAAGNADATLRLAADLAPELEATQLDRVFAEIDIPHIPVLARMEQRGLAIDREALEILGVELAEEVEAAEQEVYSAVGHEFQVGSPQQLSQVLFEELELPKSRKTATGWTTDANALEPLRQAHPAVDAVLKWRELSKIKSTYVDTLPLQIHPQTGRVHTVFSQTVAATGRLSSNDPNLQNIPVRSEVGNAVRSAFVARDCGEDPLLLSFDSVEPDAVDAEMRRRAKVFNFGVLYGLTAFGLSQREGIPRDEAEEFIRAYFEAYPAVAQWRDDVVAEARERGYAETLAGRRRYIPELRSRNRNRRQAAERIAINMPIQGTAADIIKIAMNEIDAELLDHRKGGGQAHMVLQVHDELLFELPRAELDPVREIAQRLMPSIELAVPLELDEKLGRSWGEME
jgi:DNA polymerase-1